MAGRLTLTPGRFAETHADKHDVRPIISFKMLVNVASKSLNAGITKFPKLSNGMLNLDFGEINLCARFALFRH